MQKFTDTLAEVLGIAGPICLAVMGAIVTVSPPDAAGYAKSVWIGAFAIIGALSAIGAIWTNRVTARKTEAMLTGGDNYCFFRVMPADLKASETHFQIFNEATGTLHNVNYWISPASAKMEHRNPVYWSIAHPPIHFFPTVYEGRHAVGIGLPAGEYIIQFDGRNGHWREYLTLEVRDGLLVQTIRVETKDGVTLREIEEP